MPNNSPIQFDMTTVHQGTKYHLLTQSLASFNRGIYLMDQSHFLMYTDLGRLCKNIDRVDVLYTSTYVSKSIKKSRDKLGGGINVKIYMIQLYQTNIC